MSTRRLTKILGLILAVGLLLAVLPMQAKAETGGNTLNVANWSAPANTGLTGRETVLKDGDTYHMWYSADEVNLYHASSSDPASFTAGTLATFSGEAPAEVGSVSVVNEGGTFYMVAYGVDNSEFAIYTSSDGNAWTKVGVIFDGTNKFTDFIKIDGPYLIRIEDKYRLYFQVATGSDYAHRSYDIYVAESSTITETYILANGNNPVLTKGATDAWDGLDVMQPWVVEDNGAFYMWYSGDGSGKPQSLGMAKSADGYTWVKSPANPIFAPAIGYAEPSVITDGSTWQMWTMGTGGVINYLTATGPFEFSSIQAAIDAAQPGDTIYIHNGVYTGNVTANKPLNFVGEVDGENNPLPEIQGTLTVDLSSYDGSKDWRVDNLKFTDVGGDALAVKSIGSLTVNNCVFDGNDLFLDGHRGIQATGSGNYLTVNNSVFQNGWYVSLQGLFSSLNVSRSIFKDVKSGINIQGSGSNTVTVEDSTFSVIAQGVANDTYGVRFASGTANTGGDLNITNSSFVVDKAGLDAEPGTFHSAIIIRSGATGILTVENNQIFGEVVNQSPVTLDATPNWWGSPDGPAAGIISGPVTYNPWYNTEAMITKTFKVGTGETYTTIQSAVNAAGDGDTVLVAAGTYDEENILITKGITLQGAGAANTSIAPSTTTNKCTIVVQNPSGNVTIDGFNFVMQPKPNYGSAVLVTGTGIPIDSATVTISNNVVTGSNDGSKADFGFYGQGNNAEIIIKNNTINKTGDNPIVMEQQFGSTTVEYNTFFITDLPDYSAYYSMVYSGQTILTPQIVQNNVFHLDHSGSGYSEAITFTTAVLNAWGGQPNDTGHYTNIQIKNNTIYTGGPYARGIGLHDRSSALGNGTITGAVVTGNKIIGEAAADAETYGITLRGDIQGAVIQNNEISNVNLGFKVQKNLDSGSTLICSSGTDFSLNKVTSVITAVQNSDCTDAVDASPNWWGSPAGPGSDQIFGTVDFTPWCKDADCVGLAPDDEGVIDLTPPEGGEPPLPTEIQNAINNAPEGSTIVIPADTYVNEGAFVINTPNLTIKLSDGTVIQNSSPCFEVTTNDVTITSETIGGAICKPTGTDNGIDVAANLVGISIIGIEFDGTESTSGNAIDFAGNIDHFQIVNNIFHNFAGSAIYFNGTATNNDGIQGNLFKLSTLGDPAIVTTSALNAQYNNWDAITNPTIENVDTSNNTYASLRLESMNTPWANQVVTGETIKYSVVADLKNVTGAAFTLSYPTNLTLVEVDPILLPGVFTSEIVDTTTPGELVYQGYNEVLGGSPVDGEGIVLFTVSFTGASTGSGSLTFSEDGFSMMPPLGPTNLVYTNAMTDGSVDVIDLPTLEWKDDGTLYSVGYPHDFTLTITNPATGGTFNPYLVFDSGNFTITGDTTVGTLNPGDTKVLSLQITFTASGTQPVQIHLKDPNSDPAGFDLAYLAPNIPVGANYSVFGEISMQGRTFRGNVPVLLTKLNAPVYGPFPGTTVAKLGTNLTISNLPMGGYELTTNQPRYLNVTADLDKQFTLGEENYTLPALGLRGGNAYWKSGAETYDNSITISDASLVGDQYHTAGGDDEFGNNGDCNFDGVVNIFDLALVGGNYTLTSATAYDGWLQP